MPARASGLGSLHSKIHYCWTVPIERVSVVSNGISHAGFCFFTSSINFYHPFDIVVHLQQLCLHSQPTVFWIIYLLIRKINIIQRNTYVKPFHLTYRDWQARNNLTLFCYLRSTLARKRACSRQAG